MSTTTQTDVDDMFGVMLRAKCDRIRLDPRFADFERNPGKMHPVYLSGVRIEIPYRLVVALIASGTDVGDAHPHADRAKLEKALQYLEEQARGPRSQGEQAA